MEWVMIFFVAITLWLAIGLAVVGAAFAPVALALSYVRSERGSKCGNAVVGFVYAWFFVLPWYYFRQVQSRKPVSSTFIVASHALAYAISFGLLLFFNYFLAHVNNSNTIPLLMILMALLSASIVGLCYWSRLRQRQNPFEAWPHYLYVTPFIPLYIDLILVLTTVYADAQEGFVR